MQCHSFDYLLALDCFCTFHLKDGRATHDVFGVQVSLNLGDILQFITGARTIPAEGFPEGVRAVFDHSTSAVGRFPSVNTCTCKLTIPVWDAFLDEEKSKLMFREAVIGSQFFGNI